MMEVLAKTDMLCCWCLKRHPVQTVRFREDNIFNGVLVEYPAEYFYCDVEDGMYADEEQILANDTTMKDAYREKVGLLTSHQIKAIRAKYGISQRNLCRLLGWGTKTITRFENYRVQDEAHDAILRRLDSNPAFFLQLLEERKEAFPTNAYETYLEIGAKLLCGAGTDT